MVGTLLIGCLAVIVSAVTASPMTNEAVPNISTSNAEIKSGIARLHKSRNNKRIKRDNVGGNWNGAVQYGRTGVSTVSALVTVPTPSIPPGGASDIEYAGAAWVGIDGATHSPLWQAGVSWAVNGSAIGLWGWWDWCTSINCAGRNFDEFKVNAGDVVSMIVSGQGSSGTAYLTNTNTEQMVYKTVTGMPGSLSGVTAEWIVEDPTGSKGFMPFSSFNPVTFSQCSFADSAGGGLGIGGADFSATTEQSDGKTVVYTTQISDDSFMVTYNGTSN